MNIDRFEVTPGFGTAMRYGGVVAWADPAASPALISFLAQSVRNLGPSSRGGRQIADHIAGVLVSRDPEPAVGFAVIGPSDHGWATLLHGPVQVWDGTRWLYPPPSPGWVQAIITPRPAITVSAKGAATPAMEPSSILDLEAGIVPGAGFVLLPAVLARPASSEQPDPSTSRTVAMPAGNPTVLLESLSELESATLSPPLIAPRPAPAADIEPEPEPVGDPGPDELEEQFEPASAPEAGPEPELVPVAAVRPTVAPGPAGSLDLRGASASSRPPLPRMGGTGSAVPGTPVVAGITCRGGHLNRPGLTTCVRCGRNLAAGGETVSGSRPPLGTLILDDGTLFRVDRPYLVGSDPSRDPSVGGGLARPLALSGGDVSGTHAELRLNDWDVVLVDRGSAAGTSVFEPGSAGWVRLNSFEPRPVPPGTHMAFGQRIVTFIGPWPKRG